MRPATWTLISEAPALRVGVGWRANSRPTFSPNPPKTIKTHRFPHVWILFKNINKNSHSTPKYGWSPPLMYHPPTSWNEASNSRPYCWETQWLDISGGPSPVGWHSIHPSLPSQEASGVEGWTSSSVFHQLLPGCCWEILEDIKSRRFSLRNFTESEERLFVCDIFLVSLDEWHRAPNFVAPFIRGNHSKLP